MAYLLAQFLRARYSPRVGFLKASIWPGTVLVIHGGVFSKPACLWRLGMGHFISIWEDSWYLGFMIYDLRFSLVIKSGLQDQRRLMFHRSLTELINHEIGCWDSQLVTSLFMPFEAEQILHLPLLTHTRRDSIHSAHVLAKFALYNSDHFWFDETPNCISDAVPLDSLPSFV